MSIEDPHLSDAKCLTIIRIRLLFGPYEARQMPKLSSLKAMGCPVARAFAGIHIESAVDPNPAGARTCTMLLVGARGK